MTRVFTGLVGTWVANVAFAHLITNAWLMRNQKHNAWQDLPIGWFEDWPRSLGLSVPSLHDSDTVMSSKLQKCDENWTFTRFDAICTQFSVTPPHSVTVHDFLTVLTDPACRHESDFSQQYGSGSTGGGTCTQFKAKHQSKHQRVLPAYMAFHTVACYNGFNTCVCGF